MAQEGYKPTSGMKAAARRAIKWREDGKSKGAGTPVGWVRASQLVRGESLSLSTVKRMYSFFSRHEVDKKGEGFYSGPNFPSKGRVMWDAWGGDAGFSWSRKIVEREKNAEKAKFSVGAMVSWGSSGGTAKGKIVRIVRNGKINVPGSSFTITGTPDNPAVLIRIYKDGKPTDTLVGHKMNTLRSSSTNKDWHLQAEDIMEEIKVALEEAVNPITVEIEEDESEELEELSKGLRPEVTKEQLYALVEHLSEAIEAMIEMPEEDEKEDPETESEDEGEDMETENPAPVGDPEKNQINWPVAKSMFSNLDPFDLVKRKFTTEQRRRMAEEGKAMPDGSYPIANRTDLMNAIRSWGRGGADPKVKEHIKRRAKALGASDMIPDNWK